jgi:hypothetical protein
MGNPMPLPTHVQIPANMKVIGTENYKDEAHIATYTNVRQIIFQQDFCSASEHAVTITHSVSESLSELRERKRERGGGIPDHGSSVFRSISDATILLWVLPFLIH